MDVSDISGISMPYSAAMPASVEPKGENNHS